MSRKNFVLICAIAWVILIFTLSSQIAAESNNLSSTVTRVVHKFLSLFIPNSDISSSVTNHFVRKAAHFFAYLILGVLVASLLRLCGVKSNKSVIVALLICIALAAGDEIHQTFVPGRGGRVTDVILDSCGALVGIGLTQLITRYLKK